MTPRERLLKVIHGEIPDCVPVAPDFSNMIPAKMTGKPYWDLHLYNNPPPWEAYIQCARYFNIDSVMDGYFQMKYRNNPSDEPERENETFIVQRKPEWIVTQASYKENGKRVWHPWVNVFYRDDPPTYGYDPKKIGLPEIPTWFEPLEGVNPVDRGPEGLNRIKNLMGDQGLVGVFLIHSYVLYGEESAYDYCDYPEKYERIAEERIDLVERRFAEIMEWPVKPDFLCLGGSGTMIWNPPETFRKLCLPALKRATELASAAGMPTHIHSCGPEKELVKMMAEETSLTMVDPLEIPQMGDCNLKELKRLYGNKITLKGNLHTTEVMLRGSVADVVRASKQAIDDAAAGGRFILSMGDQCGRDTPFDNLNAMVETARTYGKY